MNGLKRSKILSEIQTLSTSLTETTDMVIFIGYQTVLNKLSGQELIAVRKSLRGLVRSLSGLPGR